MSEPRAQTTEQIAFIRQWIEALRSGRYSRTQGIHKIDDETYCAVGLGYSLCDGAKWSAYDSGFVALGHNVAPKLLIKQSGLTQDELLKIVYEYNDQGKPFSAVADFLESFIPKEQAS